MRLEGLLELLQVAERPAEAVQRVEQAGIEVPGPLG
jgi:hypothetical protein